jgi:hypothetical protein
MPNYYELLEVSPTATSGEIETALDSKYNVWRRLVTHHDPNVVNQANQALAMLEQVRGTLTDPGKRSVYDAAIGIGGQQFGGLADPTAILETSPANPVMAPMGTAVPPLVRREQATGNQQQVVQRTDAWVCPKCQTANTVGAQFCAKCGNQIAHNCPNCNTLTEVANPFCPSCGANKQQTFEAKQEAEISSLQESINTERMHLNALQNAANRWYPGGANQVEKEAYNEINSGLGCAAFLLIWPLVLIPGGICSSMADGSGFLAFIGGAIGLAGFVYLMRFLRQRAAKKKIEESNGSIMRMEQRIKSIQATPYSV